MLTASEVLSILQQYRIRFGTERQMQDDIEQILRLKTGWEFTREAPLGDAGIIDFIVGGSVGIECKVAGGYSAVMQQLVRYAERAEVTELILVTSRHTHRACTQTLMGKPCYVLWVARCL